MCFKITKTVPYCFCHDIVLVKFSILTTGTIDLCCSHPLASIQNSNDQLEFTKTDDSVEGWGREVVKMSELSMLFIREVAVNVFTLLPQAC